MSYADPLIKTVLPGKKSKRVLSKDKKYTSSSYIKEYPLVVERGDGAVVVDRNFADKSVDIFSEVLSRKEKEMHG